TGFKLDLAHGAFPLTVGYPIFLSHAIRWMAHTEDDSATQVRTGAPVSLDAPPTAGKITITKPDGSRREITASSRGGAIFDDADEVGIYSAAGDGGFKRMFAANLADYGESDIT